MATRSTDRAGRNFSAGTIEAVWRKGVIVPGVDPALRRKDVCGAWIDRPLYGNTYSSTGWEIDHIVPVARGGSNDLTNLQPLQWENNRQKGDDYPHWSCAIAAR